MKSSKNPKPFPVARLQPAANFIDPRRGRAFDPEAWPLCNGTAAPPPAAKDPFDRRCLEFLAIYYKVNLLNRRLQRAPKKNQKSAFNRKKILNQIKRAFEKLEALEDRYEPIGFYGEPVMDGYFYKDIRFIQPRPPNFFPVPQSSLIAIPGLEEIPKSELVGPVKIVRLGYAKMDL